MLKVSHRIAKQLRIIKTEITLSNDCNKFVSAFFLFCFVLFCFVYFFGGGGLQEMFFFFNVQICFVF